MRTPCHSGTGGAIALCSASTSANPASSHSRTHRSPATSTGSWLPSPRAPKMVRLLQQQTSIDKTNVTTHDQALNNNPNGQAHSYRITAKR
eukprot:1843595-Amphidinium_carterae.1